MPNIPQPPDSAPTESARTQSAKDAPSCNRLGCDCSDRREIFKDIVQAACVAWAKREESLGVIVLGAEAQWFGPEDHND